MKSNEPVSSWTTGTLAAHLGARLVGPGDTPITGAAAVDDAEAGDIVRAENARFQRQAFASAASAVLVEEAVADAPKPLLCVPRARLAFARCLELFDPGIEIADGVHPSATVSESASLGAGCCIGPGAVVGDRVRLGEGVRLHPGAVVMHDAELGDECEVFPNAVVYPRCRLGRRVRLHAGAVIGADGYAYEQVPTGHYKVPQIGIVRIEDDVEIGAGTTIDRATTGETVIGRGTRIDNLVQVGHNVRIGENCLLVAHCALGGSCRLGDGVLIAGKAGLKDHVTVGDGAWILGGAEVWRNIRAGEQVSGKPARPHREEQEMLALVRRLPRLVQRVEDLEQRLAGENAPPDSGPE